MLGEWGDLFIIDNYLTRSDLGVYSFGFKIAAVYIVIIASPFNLVWNPFFMRYMNHANIRQICSSVVCYYYYISILFIFLTQIFTTKILKLINVSDNFIESCYFIPLLMSAFFISSLQNLYSIGFFYARKPQKFIPIYIVSGLLNIPLSIYAANKFGIIGVIFIFIFIKSLSSFWVYYSSKKFFAFKVYDNLFIVYLIICFLLFVILTSMKLQFISIFIVLSLFTFSFLIFRLYKDFNLTLSKLFS